jgi:hypothetical protein
MIWKVLLIGIFLVSFVFAECDEDQIDLNSASLKDLEKITWIGPATAQKIIDGRPYDNIDDLNRVKGIGETKMSDIKAEGLACVSEEEEESVEEVEEEEEAKTIEEEIVVKGPLQVRKEPIILNNFEEKQLVYESKNAKMMRYLPYAFSLLLIFVIAALLMDK